MNTPRPFSEFGASSIQGTRDKMQDVFSVQFHRESESGVGARFHVFDGHGYEGELAAQIASDVFMQNLHVPVDDLPDVFHTADAEIAKHVHEYSGTTATVVDINVDSDGQRKVVAHYVGDSPAFLMMPEGGAYESTLQTLHGTRNSEEVERMKAVGVKRSKDGEYFVRKGFSLAMSRSLGDRARRGIIADPQTFVWDGQGAKVLVVASDGVFSNNHLLDAFHALEKQRSNQPRSLQKTAEYMVSKYAEINKDNATLILAELPDLNMS